MSFKLCTVQKLRVADSAKSSDGQILTSEALLELYQNPGFAQFLKKLDFSYFKLAHYIQAQR